MIKTSVAHSPLILSIPHAGELIPQEISERMTDDALIMPDTDWFVDRLYQFSASLNITSIQSEINRYVIDLNRGTDNHSLYPGQFTTGLCPLVTFDDKRIYRKDMEPDPAEVNDRIMKYWLPYHQQLIGLISEAKDQFGYAIILDAHSIASIVPNLFEGQLTDLNYGTNHGKSCCDTLLRRVKSVPAHNYSQVYDGRFKGGYITRQYGDPVHNIHTIQLEISQACYLDEGTKTWHSEKAATLMTYLKQLCHCLLDWRPQDVSRT